MARGLGAEVEILDFGMNDVADAGAVSVTSTTGTLLPVARVANCRAIAESVWELSINTAAFPPLSTASNAATSPGDGSAPLDTDFEKPDGVTSRRPSAAAIGSNTGSVAA